MAARRTAGRVSAHTHLDRKSTRLNSSHPSISYAVFCLKKKHQAPHHLSRCGRASHRTSDTVKRHAQAHKFSSEVRQVNGPHMSPRYSLVFFFLNDPAPPEIPPLPLPPPLRS